MLKVNKKYRKGVQKGNKKILELNSFSNPTGFNNIKSIQST